MADQTPLVARLDALTKLHPKSIDMGLERVMRLLADLGNPQLDLPPVMHAAGTNGKGSTVATARAILEAHGKICHVMTSPHLVRFNERIVVAGQEISDAALVAALEEVERVNAGKPITFFEATTAAGFLAFARARADFTLLEVGMGGRLDATNVVPRPAVSVITMISYDHQQYLGNTLGKIATEKAGIMKRNVPCVVGYQTEGATQDGILSTFETQAEKSGTPIVLAGRDWHAEAIDQQNWRWQFKDYDIILPRPNLIGDHQIQNAGNALTASAHLLPLDVDRTKQALRHIHWPARLQKLPSHPFAPIGCEVYLDGGHNDSAGDILAAQAAAWQWEDYKKLHLVLGMLTTKDPVRFIKPLAPYLGSITCIAVPDETLSFTAPDLAAHMPQSTSCPVYTADLNAPAPLPYIAPADRLLIAGSLYLAGRVLKSC